MKKSIPITVVRKIIADILIDRGNGMLEDADNMANEQVATDDYIGEVETTSCGTYALADDVLSGYLSIEEALNNILTPEERKLAKQRCMEWLNKEKETER